MPPRPVWPLEHMFYCSHTVFFLYFLTLSCSVFPKQTDDDDDDDNSLYWMHPACVCEVDTRECGSSASCAVRHGRAESGDKRHTGAYWADTRQSAAGKIRRWPSLLRPVQGYVIYKAFVYRLSFCLSACLLVALQQKIWLQFSGKV